ncbi:MAG: hypothetical protein ACRECH_10885 [Nitrososphaerales archaeon]
MKALSYVVRTRKNSRVEAEILKLAPVMAKLFPELNGVTLTIINSRSSYHVASYEWHSGRIEMNFGFFERDREGTLPFVLAHETMHAVQWMTRSIPHGEKACDVFTLARLPVELFPRKKAFYVKVPKRVLSDPSRISESAKKAIYLRSNGLRRYIMLFEKELKRQGEP